MYQNLVASIGVGLCCFVMAGCGDGRPSLVTVTGTVTLNGEPVEGAQVGFEPQGISDYDRPSMAITDAQGKFTAGTYDKTDGMPAGSYRVSVFKKDVVGKIPEGYNTEDTAANAKPLKYQWGVPKKYSTTAESGITVEVTSEGLKPDTIALTGEAEMEQSGGQGNEP